MCSITSYLCRALSGTAIAALPEESFYDLTTDFLRAIDAVYFNDGGLAEPSAAGIRPALASRMMASHGRQRLRDYRSSSIERHIGPAIAVLFFDNYSFIPPPTSYLYAKGVVRIDAFLPTLTRLIASGLSLIVALVTLNLMEVSTKPTHLPFVVAAAKVPPTCVSRSGSLRKVAPARLSSTSQPSALHRRSSLARSTPAVL